MALKTVFLDAGGVLVFPNWMRVSDALARQGVRVVPEVLAAAEPHAKRQLDTGEMIQTTNDTSRGWMYFNLVLTAAGVPLTKATDAALAELHEYHRQQNLWEFLPAHVMPALQAMKTSGLKLVVVSNANGTLYAKFERLGLASLFDCLLDSCEWGVEKPDPRLFRIALDKSGASPDTTIHVGDLYHVDVVGARAAGIRGVLLDQAGLYPEADCPRVQSLDELVSGITARRFD